MIEERIFTRLSGNAGLSALVGSRIYGGTLPQNVTLPAIIYFLVNDKPLNSLSGENARKNGRYQFDIYAQTYRETKLIKAALLAAMAPYGTDFKAVRIDGSDRYEKDVELHRLGVDYSIWYV